MSVKEGLLADSMRPASDYRTDIDNGQPVLRNMYIDFGRFHVSEIRVRHQFHNVQIISWRREYIRI